MQRTQNRQAGFNIVELLLVIVAIGVIGAGGWFVYQHNRVKPADAAGNSSPSQQTTTTTPPANATYLNIKEWGVRLALDSSTATLYYYIDPQNPNVAFLSLKAISDVAPLCAADRGALAAIGRLTEAQHQAIVSGTASGNPGTVHIGNYWYSYDGSHADCTGGNADTQAAINKAAPSFDSNTLQKPFATIAASPAN